MEKKLVVTTWPHEDYQTEKPLMRGFEPDEKKIVEEKDFDYIIRTMVKHARMHPDAPQYDDRHPDMANKLEEYLGYASDPDSGYLVRARVYDKDGRAKRNVNNSQSSMALDEKIAPYIEERRLSTSEQGPVDFDALDIMVELYPLAASGDPYDGTREDHI